MYYNIARSISLSAVVVGRRSLLQCTDVAAAVLLWHRRSSRAAREIRSVCVRACGGGCVVRSNCPAAVAISAHRGYSDRPDHAQSTNGVRPARRGSISATASSTAEAVESRGQSVSAPLFFFPLCPKRSYLILCPSSLRFRTILSLNTPS